MATTETGLIVTFDDDDVLWALELAAERQSSCVGKGERDARGCGEGFDGSGRRKKMGALDCLSLHDAGCLAFACASGLQWLSCGVASEVDFRWGAGRVMLVASEGASLDIEVPSSRLKSTDVVVAVMRRADERVFSVVGSTPSTEALGVGKRSDRMVFDPTSGRYADAVRVSLGAFVYDDAWSELTSAHNEVVLQRLSCVRSDKRNTRQVDPDALARNHVVLDQQLLLRAMLSAGKKRLLFGLNSGFNETCPLEAHFLGALGERGLIKLGFTFLSPANTYKRMDFAGNVWLGTRRRNDWDLIIQPEDIGSAGFRERRHVLAVQKEPRVMRYVGYITGGEILELIASGTLTTEDPTGQNRKKSYFVKQGFIQRTVEELLELIRSEGGVTA